MNKDVADKWIEALRSGKYAQTRRALHRTVSIPGWNAGYCCLGVLCEISAVDDWFDKDGDGMQYYLNQCTILPALVQKWAHIGTVIRLINMNDAEGRSFDYIADYIETYWEAL